MSTLAPEPPQAPPQPPSPPPEEEREFMAPRPTGRQRRNSSRVNATISLIVHLVIGAVAFFFAAREGYLGKNFKAIAVVVVPKEKKPEPPKPKAPEPKKDLAKDPVKQAAAPKAAPAAARAATAPPPVAAPPPAVTTIPSFDFNDGAKKTDPISVYKDLVEYSLRTRWNKPENIADDNYVAEVNLSVDQAGKITGYDWLKGSNDKRWDDSVKQVLGSTKTISRPPPAGFPGKFVVRFDVEAAKTEPVLSR